MISSLLFLNLINVQLLLYNKKRTLMCPFYSIYTLENNQRTIFLNFIQEKNPVIIRNVVSFR